MRASPETGTWRSARTVAATGAALSLLACAPSPAAAVRALRRPLDATALAAADVTAPVVALLALIAWVLAGWLLAAAALTACSRLPGVAGRLGAAVLRRVAPATVRRCLELALGLTVATGVVAGPASASYAGAEAGPAAPAAATVASAPLLDWPSAPAAPAVVQAPDERRVVVAPGDTLWGLAERSLPATATPAQIAAAWPAWWSANRDVIGDDPDLLHPGAVLSPPASR
jgi:nucleoid-associated protein YgaU